MSRGEIRSYRDLQVWQKGMGIAEEGYRVAAALPKDELFGMAMEIKRSAASIPANIAEGYGRDSLGNYVQFLRVASGSLKELETHLLLAERVGLVDNSRTKQVLTECDALGRMLRALIRSLQRKNKEMNS